MVGLVALIVFFMTAHKVATGTAFYAVGTTPLSAAAWFLVLIASLVMVVMWIGALIRLAQLHSWGWFAGILVLQLIGLGIVGMVVYAAAGPEDTGVVARPTVT